MGKPGYYSTEWVQKHRTWFKLNNVQWVKPVLHPGRRCGDCGYDPEAERTNVWYFAWCFEGFLVLGGELSSRPRGFGVGAESEVEVTFKLLCSALLPRPPVACRKS
eukprot:12644636-Alexandrium_andersonii.AAC.1